MNKTKKQLVDELANLRRRIAEAEAGGGCAAQSGIAGEAGLKALVDNAPDIIFSYNLDGVFLYCNGQVKKVLGYLPEELIGKSFAEAGLLAHEDLLKAMAKVEENRRGLVTGPDEYNLMAKDGSIVVVEARGVPVVKGGGVEVIGIARDITERKRMECELDTYRSNLEKSVAEHTAKLEREMADHGRAKEALRASDERLRAFIDNSPDAVFVNDVQGKILHVNRKAEELCGFSQDEVIGKSVFDLGVLPSGSGTWIETLLRGIVEGRIGGPYEFELNRKDGGSVSIEAYAFPVIRDWGMDIVGIAKDITERKRAQKSIEKSEELLSAFMNSATDAFTIWDADFKLIDLNKAAMAYLPEGAKKEDVIGRDLNAFLPNITESGNFHLYRDVLATGQPMMIEDVIPDPAGGNMYLNVRAFKVGDGIGIATTDITERRRTEEALRASEEKYRGIFDESIATVYVFDANKNFINTNQAGLDLLGYSREELLRMSIPDVDADPVVVLPAHQELLIGGRLINYEHKLRRKDGTIVSVLNNSRPLTDAQGNVVGMLSTLIDITERKRAEEALRKNEGVLRSLLDATPAGVGLLIDRVMIKVNNALCNITGYTREELEGSDVRMLYLNEEEYLRIGSDLYAQMDEEGIGVLEATLKHKNGEAVYVSLCLSPFDPNDRMAGVTATVLDITERKKAEEALRNSEEKLRVMFRSMNDGVVVSDLNINVVDVNKAALDMAGYDTEEGVVGRNALEFIKFKDQEKVFADIYRMFQEPDLQERGEYWVVLPTGRELEVEVNTSAMYNDAGSPVGFINVIRDITNRKKAEQALRNSEERLRIMFESIKDAVVVTDLEVKVQDVNAAALETFGYEKEDLIGRSGLEIIAPEDRERAFEKIASTVLSPNMLERQEYKLLTKDGRRLDTDISISVICDANGKAEGFLGVMRDVTARKKADEALRASEEKLRLMFESIEDGIFVVDLKGNVSEVNEAVTRMIGYSKQELLQGRMLDYVVPEYRDLTVQGITRAITDGRTRGKVEFPITVAGGRVIEIEASAALLRDGKGNPNGLIGTVRDVTERKRADKALRDSEERYRLLAENVSDVIWTMNMNLEFTYISPSVRWMLRDYTLNDIANMKVQDLIAPQSFEKAMKLLADELALDGTRAVDAYRSQVLDMELRHKDGTTLWTEVKASFIRDQAGKPIGILGVTRDITERKKAEAALRESEERYRLLAENVSDVIWIMDMDFRYLYVSPSIERMRGFTPDEAMRMAISDHVAPESLDGAVKLLGEELALERSGGADKNRIRTLQIKEKKKDGSWMWAELNVSFVRDGAGRPVGILGVTRDIDERKKAEEALKISEEYFREITENASDMIIITDKSGVIKYCSLSVERFTGYKPEELIGRSAFEVIHPDDVQRAVADFGKAVRIKDSSIPNTFRVLHKDGSARVLDGLGKNLLDNPSIAGFVMNVRDITERRKAEQALRSSEKKYRDLVEREKDVICAVDTLGFITSINSAVRTWGYTAEELTGKNFLDLIAPEWREVTAMELHSRLIAAGEYIGETMAIDRDGKLWPIEYSATAIEREGKYAGAQAIVRDISERKKAEEKIARHARRFEALHAVAQVISQSMNLDKMLSGALAKACGAMDMEFGCIFLLDFSNRALELEAYRGVSEQTVRRLSPVMLTDAGLDILLAMKEPITVLDEAIGVTDFGAIQKVVADLGARTVAAVPFSRGMDVRGVLVLFGAHERVFTKDDLDLLTSIANEIAVGVDNIKLLERTQEMSVTDELTGLYNRRHFFAMLDAEMNRAQRSGRSFSLVMLDLDGFKEYNDKFGHTNGDTILQVLAKILRASIRKSDMAFRYGGDEFAILIPAAGAQKALTIVERARAKWQKAPREQSLVFESHIGFSTGIAEFPANAESADGLIFLADAALYQAKRLGGFTDKLVSDLRTLSPEILDVATQDQVYALAATVDARDPYTYGHSKRVAGIAVKIGRSMGLAEEAISKLYAAALLHDIGKVGVPDAILTKAGRPTPEEWSIIKRHCAEGARIVSYVKELASIVPVILNHHEWYDGTGYPNGLKGSDIPLGARITSVADAYDTMITQRPYRHVVAIEEACRELRRCAGTQFDPEVVEVWCKMVEEDEKGK